MAMKSFLCVVFILTFSWFCHGFQTYTIKNNGDLEPAEGKNCTRPGYLCEDCLTSYNCFQLSNGTWMKTLVENCNDTKTTCFNPTGLCTAQPNAECGGSFTCAQAGVFPDLTDCNKYHLCTPGPNDTLVDHLEDCAAGYSYDPLTTVCSRIRVANCTRPVPECPRLNTNGPIVGNPWMYYLCRPDSDVPRVLYCPAGNKYIKDRCHDVTTDYGLDEGNCMYGGNFYRPNCTTFYSCDFVNSPPFEGRCPSERFFQYNTGRCDTFNCTSLYL